MTEGHELDMVIQIQNNLFNVCTNLATDQEQTPLYPSAYLPEGAIGQLEQEIDKIMQELPERQGFVLPGGTTGKPEVSQTRSSRTSVRSTQDSCAHDR